MAETRFEYNTISSSPFGTLGLVNSVNKRKTSNFFPLVSGPDLESSLGGSHVLGTNKSYDSSHLHDIRSKSIINTGGGSKFFGGSESLGLNTPDLLSTPVRSRNTSGLGMDSLDIGIELSNSLANFSISPKSYSNTANQNIHPISSSSVTSSPFLHSSIWNDSKSQTPSHRKLDGDLGDYLFSPFYAENDSIDKGVTKFSSLPSDSNECRVNNDFLPNFTPESTPTKSIDDQLIGMREILNKKQGKDFKIKCKVEIDDFTYRIKKLDERRHDIMKINKQDTKARGNTREPVIVKLPSTITKGANANSFIGNILNENNKKYLEDYCSTFYKRNTRGYMFVKEPTNSLKVNIVGSKAWVQIKIKIPDGSGNDQITKKLKVDVKELPVWKPANSGSLTLGGNKKFSKRTSSYSRETRKYKNNNISKRFGNGPSK